MPSLMANAELQQPALDPETLELQKRMYNDRLQALGIRLVTLVRDQISRRQPIEDRMMEDLRQYHGRYDYNTQTLLNSEAMKDRSKVFANVTRNKTNAAEARVSDMLFPADDRNWGIQPTPVPELSDQLNDKTPVADQGQPVMIDAGPAPADGQPAPQRQATAADLAEAVIAKAKKAAGYMQREIDDQLTEAKYNIEARRAIHQAAVLGTGILKGPVVVNRARRKWITKKDGTNVVQIIEISEKYKPSVEWVDTWNYFPDMAAARSEECEFHLERKFLTRKKLRELAKRPGFLIEEIRKVLLQDPKYFACSTDHLQRLRELSGVTGVIDDTRYEMWEYNGPVELEDLNAAGIQGPSDPLQQVDATILFIGPHVIRADLQILDTGDHLYSVFNWEADDASIFGYGVPFLMRTPQRVLNAGWRMMMDNSGVSVGDQVVVNDDLVEPADGEWVLKSLKLWLAKDKGTDVTKAFHTFAMNSHQTELSNIIKMASEFADQETALPMLAQGERGTAPDTVGGMSILMNAANVVLRRIIKNFDDNVSKPLITRFYDWNMQYNPKTELKGDFTIDARGTSALLVKELQSQALMNLMQFANHPVFGEMGKWANAFRKTVESLRVSPEEFVKTDEEIDQQAKNKTPQEPIQVTIERMRIESDERIAKAKGDTETQKLTLEREIAYLRFRESAMRLAGEMKMSLDELKAMLADTTIKVSAQRDLSAADAAIAGTPPSEPAGRAKAGHAYEA